MFQIKTFLHNCLYGKYQSHENESEVGGISLVNKMDEFRNRHDNIQKVILRFANPMDGKLEIKVYIKDYMYQEANLRVEWQRLKDAGAIRSKGAFRKAERWMNNNKDFVLKLIDEQFPTFWD